jgi:hypothetical protein
LSTSTSHQHRPKKHKKEQDNDDDHHNEGDHDGTPKSIKATLVTLHVTPSNPAVDPVLCAFPGGLPAALATTSMTTTSGASAVAAAAASPENATLPQFVLKRQNISHGSSSSSMNKNHNDNNTRMVLVGKDHVCRYVATSSSSHSRHEQRPFQTVVAIYDKQTKQVMVQPTAQQGFVYAVQQSVPSYLQKKRQAAAATAAADDTEATTITATTAQLVADFGSAKKQRAMKSQQANRVNVESVVGAGQISTLLADMSASNRQAVAATQQQQQNNTTSSGTPTSHNHNNNTPTAADVAQEAWRKTSLPPFDVNADHPRKIYSLSSMITPMVWQRYVQRVKTLVRDNDLQHLYKAFHLSPNSTTITTVEITKNNKKDGYQYYPSVQRLLRLLLAKQQSIATSSSSSSSEAQSTLHQQIATALVLQDFLHLYKRLVHKRFIPPISSSDHAVAAAGGLDQQSSSRLFFGTPLDIAQVWMDRFTTVDHFQSNHQGRGGGGGQYNMEDTATDTRKVGHVVSKGQADSCKFYLFIMNMMAESPMAASANIKPLADDMQLDMKDAIQLIREVGAKVERKSPEQIAASLRVPLTFPPSGRRGGRAKRK